jgi:hypothetical protein
MVPRGGLGSSSPMPPRLVGWGGFKGPPRDGVVEVGYEIAESCRRRGHATAAVRAMVAEAFAAEDVTMVIAHTLPQRNPSNQLLERLGFKFDGELRQDDEMTWRFVLPRAASEHSAFQMSGNSQPNIACADAALQRRLPGVRHADWRSLRAMALGQPRGHERTDHGRERHLSERRFAMFGAHCTDDDVIGAFELPAGAAGCDVVSLGWAIRAASKRRAVDALWVARGDRAGDVAQCDEEMANGGGPTMVVAPVSTATLRRRSKSTGPSPVVAG